MAFASLVGARLKPQDLHAQNLALALPQLEQTFDSVDMRVAPEFSQPATGLL